MTTAFCTMLGLAMPKESLNRLQENLLRMVVEEGPAFQARFGRTVRVYFEQLPLLFGLFRHVALDLELSAKARHLYPLG
jgi:hypothetical protein